MATGELMPSNLEQPAEQSPQIGDVPSTPNQIPSSLLEDEGYKAEVQLNEKIANEGKKLLTTITNCVSHAN